MLPLAFTLTILLTPVPNAPGPTGQAPGVQSSPRTGATFQQRLRGSSGPGTVAAPVDRHMGSIAGSFRPEKAVLRAGEPIWVEMRLTHRGKVPLRYEVGGDYRGALWHNRYGLFVRDSRGVLRCDLVSNPPMNFGGLGTTREVKPSETVQTMVLLNPACLALAEPGRYRVTLVHVFAEHGRLPRGCSSVSPPDVTEPSPRFLGTHTPACVQALRSFPALSSDFDLEILPYQQGPLQRTLRDQAKAERSRSPDGRNWYWYFAWACGRFACACDTMTFANQRSPEDRAGWIEKMAGSLPGRWPKTPCAPVKTGRGGSPRGR